MKRLFLFAIITLAVLSIYSCDDIIDADDNIIKSKIEYNYVKANQTKDVIMPLQKGNKWIYKVSEIDSSMCNTKFYLDSIVVYDEIIINNEKWFKVWFPIISTQEKILMTNTDIGLIYKCELCNEKVSLLAKYPDLSKDYIANNSKAQVYFTDEFGNLKTETIYIDFWVRPEASKPTKFGGKDFSGILYWMRGFDKNRPEVFTANDLETLFVPDYGLFRSDIYKNESKNFSKIQKFYELMYYSGFNGGDILQNIFELNLGIIKRSETKKVESNILTNFTEEALEILSVNLVFENSDIIIGNYNTIVNSGESFKLAIECIPTNLGYYESLVSIKTNKGDFDVKIIYRVSY